MSLFGMWRKYTTKRLFYEKQDTIQVGSLRWKLLIAVHSWWFDGIIYGTIIFNTIMLALDRFPLSESEERVYEIGNLIFF